MKKEANVQSKDVYTTMMDYSKYSDLYLENMEELHSKMFDALRLLSLTSANVNPVGVVLNSISNLKSAMNYNMSMLNCITHTLCQQMYNLSTRVEELEASLGAKESSIKETRSDEIKDMQCPEHSNCYKDTRELRKQLVYQMLDKCEDTLGGVVNSEFGRMKPKSDDSKSIDKPDSFNIKFIQTPDDLKNLIRELNDFANLYDVPITAEQQSIKSKVIDDTCNPPKLKTNSVYGVFGNESLNINTFSYAIEHRYGGDTIILIRKHLGDYKYVTVESYRFSNDFQDELFKLCNKYREYNGDNLDFAVDRLRSIQTFLDAFIHIKSNQ